MVNEDHDVPNWILDNISVHSQNVAKKFYSSGWNMWIGKTWFGWMRCHQLKLWFLEVVVWSFTYWFGGYKKWFYALCVLCVVIMLNRSFICCFILLYCYTFVGVVEGSFLGLIYNFLFWIWLFSLWSVFVLICLKWLKWLSLL